ncbi:MAG TPA: hypothetical protein VGG39_13000 [Polyangiaceae bacterium]|jgi:hypothetical protein
MPRFLAPFSALLGFLVSACGSSGAAGGSPSGHSFDCNGATCDSATQYCLVVVGGVQLPDAGPRGGTCSSFDGGAGCPGGAGASSPGQCGCYESANGELTVTECVP